MHERTRTFLTIGLPALLLPLILTAASTAEAASLSISNGFRSAKAVTVDGFDFSLDAQGTAFIGGQSYATSISLDCVVDDTNEDFDCVGIMTLGDTQADIIMDAHGDTEEARWALAASAPTAFRPIHELWGQELVPESMSLPYGWSAIDYYAGGRWIKWYYSTTWAETFTAITGMEYPATIW